ncbi:hotdog fold thioesterase [soil metagenome]
MSIWKTTATPALINKGAHGNMMEHLGIAITEVGNDHLTGTMPVDHRTIQPMGLLHGGASVVLAETLGSIAGSLACNGADEYVVGLEINANHIKSARSGVVTGIAKHIHVGGRTQVWEIRITNDANELVCISRITLAVIQKKK